MCVTEEQSVLVL